MGLLYLYLYHSLSAGWQNLRLAVNRLQDGWSSNSQMFFNSHFHWLLTKPTVSNNFPINLGIKLLNLIGKNYVYVSFSIAG
jgi:hypothetical protein